MLDTLTLSDIMLEFRRKPHVKYEESERERVRRLMDHT